MSDGVFRLDASGKNFGPSDLTAPEAFTSNDHREVIDNHFATPDEKVLSGTWECAPCREEIDAYPYHEMMTVIFGSVTLTTDADGSQTFGPGDTFFVAKGTKCVWEITETLRKFYMIAE